MAAEPATSADGEADAIEVDGDEESSETKRKRPKSEGTTSVVVDDEATAAMVRGHLS